MNKIVEVCCGSYYDAKQAYEGKAKRIELNSALSLGGLTPSLATLLQVKENTDLEVICMVRNRGAGFLYEQEDRETIFRDAKILLENGADGIAFGFLNADKSVDVENTKAMVELIHSYGKCAVYHRAIDVSNDIFAAFERCVECGVDRILTSGGCIKAVEGVSIIRKLQETYKDRIEILAGCGINEENASYVMDNTGISQIHSSCKDFIHDVTSSNFGVNFSYGETNKYEVVSKEKVEQLLASI